ncbi:MAG: GGDEF domain-containing protein [Agrobacterium vaccinii]
MDLNTVLLLHKSSLLVGAVCFMYVRWQSGKRLGLRLMAIAFILLAVGSSIAGAGERGELPYYAWTLVSLALGPLAYGLLWIGIRRLVTEKVSHRDSIVLAITPLTVIVAIATDFHLTNVYRASVFLTLMAIFMASCGVVVLRNTRSENIRARFPLALSFAAKALLGLITIASIATPEAISISVSETFFLLILCQFFIAMFVLVFAKERAETRLLHLLATDPLTQIHNRHWFFSKLPSQTTPGDTLAIIDIDHFKRVNDTFGHAAGDHVLIATAKGMAETLPRDSIFARLGGEEFGLYVKASSTHALMQQAEHLRRTVEALDIWHDGKHIPLTISLGIATVADGMAIKTLLSNADQALYVAKRNGRNRVEVFEAQG